MPTQRKKASTTAAAPANKIKKDGKTVKSEPPVITLKVSHLMDSGFMFIIPLVYGYFLGYNPVRLIIGIVYGPFYPTSFYRAWDLVYRFQDLKSKDVMEWDSLPVEGIAAPPKTAMLRWLLRLILRKASGFHVLFSLSTIHNAFIAIPIITFASYYIMLVDKTGITDLQGLYHEVQNMLFAPNEAPAVPLKREETFDEIDARQIKEIREGLDITFGVGAPVAAAAFLVWWLGPRGQAWTEWMWGI
ncbi:hypothetical protein HK100_002608 [Physocladia obscura]|uniref:Uncharacterized protein n=1 Tax=Physocladia obscura TaxID=109957 RepID=A0AAD5SV48_9FUNG|nr:hypothetical protein HK100_002608 [Physocladia obscura]